MCAYTYMSARVCKTSLYRTFCHYRKTKRSHDDSWASALTTCSNKFPACPVLGVDMKDREERRHKGLLRIPARVVIRWESKRDELMPGYSIGGVVSRPGCMPECLILSRGPGAFFFLFCRRESLCRVIAQERERERNALESCCMRGRVYSCMGIDRAWE